LLRSISNDFFIFTPILKYKMTFFALVLLDKNGKILADRPKGCQFDPAFLENIAKTESSNQAPHPGYFDMGGFWIHSLWSGIKPFIVAPEFIVGVVSDAGENMKAVKKLLRKVTNNVLLQYQEDNAVFDDYLTLLWNKIEKNMGDSIVLEKPKVTEAMLAESKPVIQPKATIAPVEKPQEYDELLDLGSGLSDDGMSKQTDPFNDDPFASKPASNIRKPTTSDPFGSNTPASDPFGSSSTVSDPFGGSSQVADPFGGSAAPTTPRVVKKAAPSLGSVKYNPNLFGKSKAELLAEQKGPSEESFDDNPWANETPTPDVNPSSIDELSENPFGDIDSSDSPPNIKKSKAIDEFDDNPFA
jgi:hypothetical protein